MKLLVFTGATVGLLLSGLDCNAQVTHRASYGELSEGSLGYVGALAKTQTVDPYFQASAPLGFPRNGVPFQIDYEIVFSVDNPSENIDYFAFYAPTGWTITSISGAPPATAAECDGNPHTSVISGFSTTSAYWGGDYGGGVVTPGDSTTYPDPASRSGCGPFETAMDPALADTHTFSITMTPSAGGECPGSTTGALPLCCSGAEITPGGSPPTGSEPYFSEMVAASDGNAESSGDAFYYVSLECPSPRIELEKAAFSPVYCSGGLRFQPDTLLIPLPAGGSYHYCFEASNESRYTVVNDAHDPWLETACDSVYIEDPTAGLTFKVQFYFPPGGRMYLSDGQVFEASAEDSCIENVASAICVTGLGTDYVAGEGVQSGTRNFNLAVRDTAWVCTETVLPVELTFFGATVHQQDIVLEWTTASETNNAGFQVEYRLADEAVFHQAAFVPGTGTSYTSRTYSYRITDPGPGRHAVRLKQVDFSGATNLSSVLLAEVEVPGDYYLTAAYPNPFSVSSNVEFAVPTAQNVRLDLVDIQGRSVRTIFNGRLEASTRRKATISASGLASGTYVVRLRGDRFEATEAITIAK